MFKLKTRSIMFKILLMILTICILESLLFTGMSEALTENILEKTIAENSRKNAELYSEFTGNWFLERMREIELYANTPIVRTMDWDKIEPYLKNEINNKLAVYDHFMIADLKGHYNSTLKRNAGNAIDREYFNAAMNGRVIVSGPIFSRTNGKPVTAVAAPIKDENGTIQGVMAGAINLVKLSKLIADLKYNYPDSYSYIVDKNGLIIAHPKEEFILKENITKKSDIIAEQMTELASEILSNDEGFNKYTYENVTTMNYYHSIPNTDNWKLIIKIPVDYWIIPISYTASRLIIIGLIVLIIASMFGYFMANSISAPIIKLKEVFTRAAAGDLTVRSDMDRADEVGDASRSFNKMMDTISNLTYFDPLTLLPNRMLFSASVDMELGRAVRENTRLAIMMLDVDKFESINNILGHTAGDKLLKSLADKISAIVDHNHTVYHMGEDRFAVLLKHFEHQREVIKLANRIRDEIKQPWIVEGYRFYITACIGMAFYPNDGDNSSSLLKNAFSAMQKAKRKGRDNYQLYEPALNAQLIEQLNLDSSMHRALDNGEFTLHYQPQVDTRSKEIIGCEVLIRWNHPELGMISPPKFIPISETNGLIIMIGRWVLYNACMQNKLWQESGYKTIFISVNLSVVQLIQEDFIDMVSDVLKETGISPEYLELEITESVAVKNHEYISSILEKLRKMGIRIALDDFGTGYSSLNYLKNFAISTLKIDRSFIFDITENPKNAAIVSTILALGHNLNLSVTAEGVETEEQYEALLCKGCDIIQGYYFGKPLPQNEFEKLIMKKPGE